MYKIMPNLTKIHPFLQVHYIYPFPSDKQTAELEHFGTSFFFSPRRREKWQLFQTKASWNVLEVTPPSGGAKEVIYHDTCTTRYQKSIYHGIKVQA
jgi:hypothetical protein